MISYEQACLLPLNQPADYGRLPQAQRVVLCNWIDLNLAMTKTYNRYLSSYVLKHYFEHSPEGFYVTNGQFKGAMLREWYKPKDYNALNWVFKTKIFTSIRHTIIPA